MAGSLIETLSGEFDPSQYEDGYREALNAVIEAKVKGRAVVRQPADHSGSGTVVDLMAALRASVEAAKKARPGSDAAPKPAKKVPAKREPAKREPAKKVPAKREPAKREPAKREPATKEPATTEPAKKAVRKSA